MQETLSGATVAGNDDFIVEVAVADVEHLRSFLLDHVTNQANMTDTNTSLVLDYRRRAVVELSSTTMWTSPRPAVRKVRGGERAAG